MRSKKGVAIIASIIVLVMVMALGVGAMFITQNNLKTAENVRSNAVARSNAESGLDAAYILVEAYYLEHGEMPSEDYQFPETDTYTLSLVSDGYSAGQIKMLSVGKSVSGAEFVSEAVFVTDRQAPSIPPELIKGLVSEGVATVNGGASLFIDAGVHGNNGFSLGGDFQVCMTRDNNGYCTNFDPAVITNANLPVSLSNPAGVCKVRSTNCIASDYLASAVTIGVNYTYRRDRAADLNGDGTFDSTSYLLGDDCDGSIPTLTNTTTNQVVCASAPVSVNNPNLRDVTVITNGNITLGGTTCNLNNVTLISLAGTVAINANACTSTNVRIFSQGNLVFSGSNKSPKSWTWDGENTLATAGSITFNGSGRHDNTIIPIYNSDGSVSVGLALVAEGDITFNGSTKDKNYYATFTNGGKFTHNGRAKFFGSIASKGSLTFNGNLEIDSGLGYVNRDLLSEGDEYLATSSRR